MRPPRGSNGRIFRRLLAAGLVLWVAAVAWLLVSGVGELRKGRAEVEQARTGLSPASLADGRAHRDLATAADHFGAAAARIGHPAVAPLRLLPVAGRQLRSAHSLATAAADVAAAGERATREVGAALASPPEDGPARLEAVERVSDAVTAASTELAEVDLGPDAGLVAPLAEARADLGTDLDHARRDLARARTATTAVAEFLRGPRRYLLLAANNAEMRAASGMFLSAGALSVSGGQLDLGDMEPTGDLRLPPPGVTVRGDFAARWGWTEPGRDWRNLGLTPRFEATAPVAADLWQARTGEVVDGVIAMDIPALEALLAATGPVTVGDLEIGEANVAQHLMHDQYTGITYDRDVEADQATRREQLGAIASATIERIEAGDADLPKLAAALADAAAGRHILMWSPRPEEQRAWEAAGVAGKLARDSLLVALLNRGGNKLDQYMQLDHAISVRRGPDGDHRVDIRTTIQNRTPDELAPYVAGPHPDLDVASGDYVGILAVTVPGAARSTSFDGTGPTVVAGADGPTRVAAVDVRVPRGATSELTTSFVLPATSATLVVEPSARTPPSTWQFRGERWSDGHRRTVELVASRPTPAA